MKRILAAFVLVAGCAATDGAPAAQEQYQSLAAPTPDGVALVIRSGSDGQNVTAKVGTRIAVELIGTPTAGYIWTPAETPAFLEAAGEYGGPTSTAQSEPGFAGGNHWEAFLFKVTGAGEGVLKFEQRRPFDPAEEPAADAFSVYLFAEE